MRKRKKKLRPGVSLLIVGAVVTGVYSGSWKYDPARLETRAQKGNAEAQYRLGKVYFDGYLLAKDNRIAREWLTKAAEQGHQRAQLSLGLMYLKGQGARQDYAMAVGWYRRAAQEGSVVAQNQLGVLYAQGKGVDRDLTEAVKWFSKAAEAGSKTARQNLTLTTAAVCGKNLSVQAKGRVYSPAQVVKVERDGITVAFEPEPGGIGFAKIRFEDLPADVRLSYGYRSMEERVREAGATRLNSLQLQL